MSRQELEQAKIFELLKNKGISQVVAAKKLGITTRWVRVKAKRYFKYGHQGLIHKNRGRASARRWGDAERKRALDILRSEDWKGFGPTYAAEKLLALHAIKINAESLRKVMIQEGLWTITRPQRKHRRRRPRKDLVGDMIQLDGSPHDWFEGRGPKCTLLVFIDDATSKIMWLEFAKSESTAAIMAAMRNYLERYGRPCSLYVDFGSAFSVNLNNPDGDKISQFESAAQELGIRIIHATSPQAKGRVERANQTMQDRLVKDMRFSKIASIQEANDFVHRSSFIADHNAKFSVPAAQSEDAHRSIDGFNLNQILCLKESRLVANDFTISYHNNVLQLAKHQKAVVYPKNRIIVHEALNGSIRLFLRNIELKFTNLGAGAPRKISPVQCVENERNENVTSSPGGSGSPFFGDANTVASQSQAFQ